MCDILHFQKNKGSLFEQILQSREAGSAAAKGAAARDNEPGLCGGRGACGKCRVRFLSAAPLPSAADRRFFAPKELRDGWRLACTAKPLVDCSVELHFAHSEPEKSLFKDRILTDHAIDDVTEERAIDGAAGECMTEERAIDDVTEERAIDDVTEERAIDAAAGECMSEEHAIGCASEAGMAGQLCCVIDLGTTTVVMQLLDKITGDILCTHTFLNPQRVYGIDVVARIANAANMPSARLQEVLLTELENGLHILEKAGKPENIIISGNTTMEHLLLGYPVDGLGKAPFMPFSLAAAHIDLFGYPALCLPGISAFVGADIVSGIYACHMAEQEEVSVLIDLGTNGEIAVGNKNRILCTATAAGSAFEGEISAQALGTDITAIAYDMLRSGIMDENGLLAEPWFREGFLAETGRARVRICQQDIRSLQLAKAAICAGVTVLLDQMAAWDKLAHVYLAGGFGYYLDVKKAVGIGLIPAMLEDKCRAVGNTSLAGAVRYARNAEKADGEEWLQHIVQISEPLNLAQQPEFESRYIEAMAFHKMQ